MAWELIEHKSSPTSNQFDFTSLSLGSYQRVMLMVDGVDVGTDDAYLLMRLSTASTLRTSGYRYRIRGMASSGAAATDANDQAATYIPLNRPSTAYGIGNDTGEAGSSIVHISNLGSGLYKHCQIDSVIQGPSGSVVRNFGVGGLDQSGAIDGVRVYLSTGTMAAGKASLYGLKTS